MSEITLNLVDAQDILHGTIHGSIADAAVAALSAEPETIPELEAALARYNKPVTPHSPFSSFLTGGEIDETRWDAGIIIIDLAARIVAAESTYSMPAPEGDVHYHDGTHATDVAVLYRVPDDWTFVYSLAEYPDLRDRRMEERATKPPLDARAILYGRPLVEWIVTGTRESEPLVSSASGTGRLDSSDESQSSELQTGSNELTFEEIDKQAAAIHARWLMTPREDLRGQSPRDVLLAKLDFIDFDLHTREIQWSLLDEGPPCLSLDSFAYRFAGFGTHECVIYYDLVRHLLWNALTFRFGSEPVNTTSEYAAHVSTACGPGSPEAHGRRGGGVGRAQEPEEIEKEITRLELIKSSWLDQPQGDFEGRIPAIIIENERKRLPLALNPRDMIIDDDCPMCQMFADETALGLGVGFWHLDGCNMDDDFAFSFLRTREEFEAEEQERKAFNEKFNREWEERQQKLARGEPIDSDPSLISNDLPDSDLIHSDS